MNIPLQFHSYFFNKLYIFVNKNLIKKISKPLDKLYKVWYNNYSKEKEV